MASSSSQPAPQAIPSHPSDIELAKMLVDPSASPPGNTIIMHDADVYAQDPDDLTQQFAATVAEDGQKAWYFSTKLVPKNQRGKRKRRCMDSGVWHDEGKSKPVVGSEGGAIGHRSLFAFFNKVDGKRTGWIMHEFRLPDGGNEEESLVVLCKVIRSSRRCATAEAQAQTQAEVEEALVKAVEAREAAVKVREEALAAREAAVEAREALARRDDADHLAVSERNLQERQSNLAAREAAWQAIWAAWQEDREEAEARKARELREARVRAELAAWRAILQAREGRELAWQPSFAMRWGITFRQEFERRLAELEREEDLAREAELREAEGEALARRDAARLAASLQERERNLAAREAAFESRLQALQEESTAELEALMVLIMAALPVARAGLLLLQLPIAGGSSPELLLPIAVEH